MGAITVQSLRDLARLAPKEKGNNQIVPQTAERSDWQTNTNRLAWLVKQVKIQTSVFIILFPLWL